MTLEGLKILIPLDGSVTSEAILPVLRPLIQSQPVETTLLFVSNAADDDGSVPIRLNVLRQALEAQGVAVRVLVHSGKAAKDIVEVADAGRFDLIAMGTHGRTRMDRILMGSVAEEAIRTTRIPVLLARPDCKTGRWDPMVVALDGSTRAEEILEDVVRLARTLKASVHLVQVTPSNLVQDDYAAPKDDFPSAETMAYLNRIAGLLRERGVSAVVVPLQGEPGPEISRLARSLGAGLIFMATEGRPESSPGVGISTTAEILGHAPCAVYVRHLSGAGERQPEGAGK